jgi:hypothetical protein
MVMGDFGFHGDGVFVVESEIEVFLGVLAEFQKFLILFTILDAETVANLC